jgi:hypothetical protein
MRAATAVTVLVMALAAGVRPAPAAEQVLEVPGARVTCDGVGETWATAIGRVTAAARNAAAAWGYDVPATVHVQVTCGPDQDVRLFNGGKERVYLSIRSEQDLRKPSVTGTYHLYGLCHEVGHLAQYRPVARHDWMTTACAEGWAHWLGSRLVDAVHAKEGPSLWPDAYDYRADGTARLARQWKQPNPGETAVGAGLWKDLHALIGDKGLAALFKAWGQAKVDPGDPAPALGNMVNLVGRGEAAVAAWWKRAAPVFVQVREGSAFEAKTIAPRDLSGRPVTLKVDDGTPAGRNSMAGSGHAVRFQVAQADKWYLRGVMIHGSRYGGSRAPEEDFHVWLCDADFRAIAEFAFPYKAFDRGEATWVPLPIRTPTLVPKEFIVCVGFNPTGSKGVFVSRDASGSGKTLAGLPGKGAQSFGAGDWLIRAVVDRKPAGRT